MKLNSKMILLMTALLMIAIIAAMRFSDSSKKEITIVINSTDDFKGMGYSGQRKIVQDSKGNYFVTYRKKYQGKYEIYVSKIYYQDGRWKVSGTEKPVVQVGSRADQRVPSISLDSKDNIYVVWYGSEARSEKQINNRQIKFIKSTDGGVTWSETKNISYVDDYPENETYWQEHPYILSANKELYVAWEGKDKENTNQQIKFSHSSDGGNSWTDWKNVFPSAGNTQSRPTFVAGSNGRLHLFLYSSAGNDKDNQQIKYSWSDNYGDSWSSLESLSDQNFDARHISAAEDLSSEVHIAWRQWDQKGNSRIIYRKLSDGVWGDELSVSDSKQNQFFPSIGSGKNGKVVISWMESGDKFGLPREDPKSGKIYVAAIAGRFFWRSREVSIEDADLYPNLPQGFNSGEMIPLVFESASTSSDSYEIILKLIKL